MFQATGSSSAHRGRSALYHGGDQNQRGLERIGDQAVNISQTTTILLDHPQLKRRLFDIPRMAELAKKMLKDALDAYVKKDVDLARSVVQRDSEEDQLKSESFHELMQLMQSDSSTVQQALGLILISRNLERIADHATNIAEDVIFMVLGKDIRHHADDPAASTAS
jgi:phosphate transport system protein